MNKITSYCGIDCSHCDTYIATIKDDDTLREKTAKLWCELNHTDEIKPEHINCLGCIQDGVKTYYCSDICEIRKCCMAKSLDSCRSCSEKHTCKTVAPILNYHKEAKENTLG